LLERYQQLAQKNGLINATQFMDWTSAYFEGNQSELGALGYSRDGQPGKKQLTIGIATGINGIPSALTVQKGNVQDKKHFATTLKTVSKILEPASLLVFDCGANTRENKARIRKLGFHYLTLRQKQRGPYRRYLRFFNDGEKQAVESNGVRYECVKLEENEQFSFVFFSRKLHDEQLRKREKKFLRELKKNDVLLRKVFRKKDLQSFVTRKGYVVTNGRLQKVLKDVPNPFVTGLEGYFILESSVNAEPEAVLRLYKQRDKAEKLIRDLKEGTELRPIRHWSKLMVLGYLFVVFLTNCVVSLTRFLSPNSLVKNVKLLKNFLQNLTVTVVYPRNGFRLRLLSNVSPEIESVLGGFVGNFGQKTFDLPS
jgi:transposase